MTRLVLGAVAFVAGAAAALVLVDRLLGGHGPHLVIDDEPGGGWQW